ERHILRQILIRSGELPRSPAGGDTFDTTCLPQELELRPGDSHPSVIAVLVYHNQVDHPARALVWERIRQQAINDAKDSRGGGDPQRERNDRGKSEGRLLAEFPAEKPKIVQHFP